MPSPLLPDRHPVRDFFVLDVMDVIPRSDMASMEHPIYSLSPRPDLRELSYEHDDQKIEIIPGSRGLPTVYDKDILIYCISKLMAMKNSGQEIGPVVRLTTHDLLVQTNKQTNDNGYKRLEAALQRLAGTVIQTTIETGEEKTVKGFSLISSYEYNRKGSMHADRLRYLEITLSDWIFRAIESAEVVPISRDYFRLRKPLDRRLYELARKHCGSSNKWRIGIDKLQKKCGSRMERRFFLRHVRQTVQSNHLPDFTMTLEGEQVVFWRRSEGNAAAANRAGQGTSALAPACAPVAAQPERRIMVSTQAIEQLYEFAPGWDKYMLEHAYIAWAKDKEAARNEDRPHGHQNHCELAQRKGLPHSAGREVGHRAGAYAADQSDLCRADALQSCGSTKRTEKSRSRACQRRCTCHYRTGDFRAGAKTAQRTQSAGHAASGGNRADFTHGACLLCVLQRRYDVADRHLEDRQGSPLLFLFNLPAAWQDGLPGPLDANGPA